MEFITCFISVLMQNYFSHGPHQSDDCFTAENRNPLDGDSQLHRSNEAKTNKRRQIKN